MFTVYGYHQEQRALRYVGEAVTWAQVDALCVTVPDPYVVKVYDSAGLLRRDSYSLTGGHQAKQWGSGQKHSDTPEPRVVVQIARALSDDYKARSARRN